ncbi:DDE-type integrase/transposase/recombinase [Rhizophagus irregularis DAOM 181602=DAOM 197198]|nr:DDE-type integrase/transposase/recombinase [Rhizophagus irregularis DAOM 181602=DAOM 197198]
MDFTTYFNILRYLESLELPDNNDAAQRRAFKRKAHYYVSIDGLLYKKNKENPIRPLRVLKKSELATVLYNFHEDPLAGHFGFSETYRAISLRYFWPQMGNDIRSYVQSCDICQRRKRLLRNEPLHPIKIGQPFDHVGMDIVGPLPITTRRNKYIVVLTEYLTKWPEARALSDAKAASVVSFFYEDVICRHGCLKVLLTNQGTHFVNELLDSLCTRLGIKHHLSTAYRPQTNGLTERFNRTLCETLAKYSMEDQSNWDLYLPSALFAYRTIRQQTTRFEPFYLTYGREATLSIELKLPSDPTVIRSDVQQNQQVEDFQEQFYQRIRMLIGPLEDNRQLARSNVHTSQEKQKQRYDAQIHPRQYAIGEQVLLKNFRPKKMDTKWNGPYYIHDRHNNGNYQLRTINGKIRKKRVHANQLRPYISRSLEMSDIG